MAVKRILMGRLAGSTLNVYKYVDEKGRECRKNGEPLVCKPIASKPIPKGNKKRIKQVSAKMSKQNREYAEKRAKFLDANPVCRARLAGCSYTATDVHHKAGRGSNLLAVATWLPVCRNCHSYIEEHPEEAKEKGLSISRLTKINYRD